MIDKYYITTPIYYVNDVPHIGHAYTSIASDVIARFMRLSGKDVMFLTGTDEHGQKIEKAALNKNILPQDFTDEVSLSFRKLMTSLNISNDDFIRTSESRHKIAVIDLWNKLQESGNIYLGTYSGWYAVRDEAFYNESELTEDGKAPTGAPVEWVEEPCYFFALSKWQNKLLEFYASHPDFVKPTARYNEVLSFVKSGLSDLCISRTSFKWGIPVPGDPKHVIYVWLDALTNYISALGYPDSNNQYKKYWPANVHIVGKDILRFHAIYWPAFLMAANLEVPHTIMAHGWWTNEGQKISKSIGNVIDPFALITEFDVDYVRYFLIREVPFGSDGNYSKKGLISRSHEIANNVGNLLHRTISLIHQNNNGIVPKLTKNFIQDLDKEKLILSALNCHLNNIKSVNNFQLNIALENIILLSDEANIYINDKAPWALKKTDPDQMFEVLYILLETLRYIGIMLLPFIPTSANKILNSLSVPENERTFLNLSKIYRLKENTSLSVPTAVFRKIIIE